VLPTTPLACGWVAWPHTPCTRNDALDAVTLNAALAEAVSWDDVRPVDAFAVFEVSVRRADAAAEAGNGRVASGGLLST
jgi:hypothetical protein